MTRFLIQKKFMSITTKGQWIQRHLKDQYVKRANEEGFQSRASFKLLEIQERYNLLRRGQIILDLGSFPGGWSEVARRTIMSRELNKSMNEGANTSQVKSAIIAIDITPMEPIKYIDFIQGDAMSQETWIKVKNIIRQKGVISDADLQSNRLFDVVLSDMAPKFTGHKSVDIPRSVELCRFASMIAVKYLRPKGSFLCKVFQGPELKEIQTNLKKHFSVVRLLKPTASRKSSSETYLLCQKYTN